jgi:hypothetical protein
MTDMPTTALLALSRPGVVIEVDARTAEALGAFAEDALSEREALASVETDEQEAP